MDIEMKSDRHILNHDWKIEVRVTKVPNREGYYVRANSFRADIPAQAPKYYATLDEAIEVAKTIAGV